MPIYAQPAVLHYVGSDDDRGGIVAVIRALATAGQFECQLGVNVGYRPTRHAGSPVLTWPRLTGEQLSVRTFWRARLVANLVADWLRADRTRVFHGHSRAGLAVALWLIRSGERRVVASVHCYGRQRWFYRWAAARLAHRLYWLSPAMKQYYGIRPADDPWSQCIPGCVTEREAPPKIPSYDGRLRLGGIGMQVPWKRWDLIIEALRRLPVDVQARVRFTHIGAPTADTNTRRFSAALQARSHDLVKRGIVEWRGEQPNSAALLRETDCLVVASRNEPLSIAMLESLRAGVPVLASHSGGNRDVVAPSRSGWFFEPDDSGDLARIIAMLVDTDALQRISIQPTDLSRFHATTVAAQWAEVYSRLS